MNDLTESVRRRELVERIEKLTARAQRAEAALRKLTDKIEDNPTLFFGMEDTCQDEWQEACEVLAEAPT